MDNVRIDAIFDSNDTARSVQKALNRYFASIMNQDNEDEEVAELDDELALEDEIDDEDEDSEEIELDDDVEVDEDLDPFEDFGLSSYDFEIDLDEVEWEEAPRVRVSGNKVTVYPENSLANEIIQDLLGSLGGDEIEIAGDDD